MSDNQAARLMTIDAARTMDVGGEARVQIALIKFWGARMLHNGPDEVHRMTVARRLLKDPVGNAPW